MSERQMGDERPSPGSETALGGDPLGMSGDPAVMGKTTGSPNPPNGTEDMSSHMGANEDDVQPDAGLGSQMNAESAPPDRTQ
ncbi:MAG: hypothetical protein PVSMB4_18770 [Ktedonobacterales bacterium]